MSLESVIGIAAIIVTVLLAAFGVAIHLSARISALMVITSNVQSDFKDHDSKDDRRFGEVFAQQRELANQHFWMVANVKGAQGQQGTTDLRS